MYKLAFWASDLSNFSGEGKLAKNFINQLKTNPKISSLKQIKSRLVKTDKNYLNKKFSTFLYKYLVPLFGVVQLWNFYFRNYRICYVNYLPLWNFIIFLLLPPKTILGPITGTISEYNNFFLKKFFEQFSIIIIKLRYSDKLLFSNNFYKPTFKYSYHNFILSKFSKKKNYIKTKKYDFIFYIRKEFFNKNVFLKSLIEKLLKLNFTVSTIGDPININKIKNFGHCKNQKVQVILSNCKYCVGNVENLYSFFVQDCLSNGLTVFYNDNFQKFADTSVGNLYPITFKNSDLATKQILTVIKKKNQSKDSFTKTNFENYFKHLL